MSALAGHAGTWTGTNGFRLMPTDPLHEAAATARVAGAAAGHLAEVAYTWSHPADGPQDGLLVVGPGEEAGVVVAFWGDSWHQHPSPKVLDGTVQGGLITVGYTYAGDWQWQVVVDATAPEALTVTMNNVVPESAAGDGTPAGAYPAMQATLVRAP